MAGVFCSLVNNGSCHLSYTTFCSKISWRAIELKIFIEILQKKKKNGLILEKNAKIQFEFY